MRQPASSTRHNLIEAIKTPLGFFVLIVLMVEAALVHLASAINGPDRTLLIYAIVGIIVLLILLVAAIAIWRPEALWGKRYFTLEDSLARGLGEEFYAVLTGLVNVQDNIIREHIRQLLYQTLDSCPSARSGPPKRFVAVLLKTIERRIKQNGNYLGKGGLDR